MIGKAKNQIRECNVKNLDNKQYEFNKHNHLSQELIMN